MVSNCNTMYMGIRVLVYGSLLFLN
jgi:hypothetical protein